MSDSDTSETSSVLSKKQRKWLDGEDVYSSPDRVVKSRIKKRYLQAVSDMALLVESDRITSQDIRQWVAGGVSTSSNENVSEVVAEQGRINEEVMADALVDAMNKVEVFGGMSSDDATLSDLLEQFKDIQNADGDVEDEWYSRFAAMGANVGLQASGKTGKQARQWMEHHWPDSEEALGRVEEMDERGLLP